MPGICIMKFKQYQALYQQLINTPRSKYIALELQSSTIHRARITSYYCNITNPSPSSLERRESPLLDVYFTDLSRPNCNGSRLHCLHCLLAPRATVRQPVLQCLASEHRRSTTVTVVILVYHVANHPVPNAHHYVLSKLYLPACHIL